MITDQTPRIIQPEKFWWEANELKSLFSLSEIAYDYNPYSIKFIERCLPNMISIESSVRLAIILGNTQLLDAGLIIHFHIKENSFDNLKEELLRTGKDAHERFMISFEERRSQSAITEIYQPTFEASILLDKIENLLQNNVTL